jgi:pimeloyl-ACP methyl ester carboxylesterase
MIDEPGQQEKPPRSGLVHNTIHGGYTIFRNTVDAGRPHTVFLHGGPGFSNYAERHLMGPVIHDRVNVIWFDMLGCHASPARDLVSVNLENTLADVHEIICRFSDGRANLVGNCIGSHMVHAFAKRYPDALNKAVFLSPNESVVDTFKVIMRAAEKCGKMAGLDEGGRSELRRFLAAPEADFGMEQFAMFLSLGMKTDNLFDLYWLNKEAMASYFRLVSEASLHLEIFVPMQVDILNEPPVDYDSLYSGRDVLVVQGELDDITAYGKNGKLIVDRVRNAKAAIIPGCSHWPHIEALELTCRHLCDFLGDS